MENIEHPLPSIRRIALDVGRSILNVESLMFLSVYLKRVASAILADVEPVRPARRKERRLEINLLKWGVSAQRTVFSGRQDAGLHGRRDARRYLFRQALK